MLYLLYYNPKKIADCIFEKLFILFVFLKKILFSAYFHSNMDDIILNYHCNTNQFQSLINNWCIGSSSKGYLNGILRGKITEKTAELAHHTPQQHRGVMSGKIQTGQTPLINRNQEKPTNHQPSKNKNKKIERGGEREQSITI